MRLRYAHGTTCPGCDAICANEEPMCGLCDSELAGEGALLVADARRLDRSYVELQTACEVNRSARRNTTEHLERLRASLKKASA